MPALEHQDVLDIGCGTGRFSRFLAGRGARVVGLDFSPRSLDLAQRLSSGVNPSYRLGSMFELEDRQAFDMVFAWASLTMACSDGRQLREVMVRVRRALKPGGTVIVAEPVHKGFLCRSLDMGLGEFCAIMRRSGLVMQEVRQLHFWPARFALAFVSWPDWLTRFGYSVGQGCMRLPGLRQMGDYKAIRAAVPPKVGGRVCAAPTLPLSQTRT